MFHCSPSDSSWSLKNSGATRFVGIVADRHNAHIYNNDNLKIQAWSRLRMRVVETFVPVTTFFRRSKKVPYHFLVLRCQLTTKNDSHDSWSRAQSYATSRGVMPFPSSKTAHSCWPTPESWDTPSWTQLQQGLFPNWEIHILNWVLRLFLGT